MSQRKGAPGVDIKRDKSVSWVSCDQLISYLSSQARKAEKLSKTFSPVDGAADERLKKEVQDEEISIKRTCDELGVKIHEVSTTVYDHYQGNNIVLQVPPDGHCLFSSVGDQLALLNIVPQAQAGYPALRYAASNYIYTHPDDFLPFLASSSAEDGVGETDTGFMSRAEFERYCTDIRDTGVWGGEPEILALSRAYNVPIHVVQGRNPAVVIHNPTGDPRDGHLNDNRVVRISYHRRMYGLGEVSSS